MERNGDFGTQTPLEPPKRQRRAPWSAEEVEALRELGPAYTGKGRWVRLLKDHAGRFDGSAEGPIMHAAFLRSSGCYGPCVLSAYSYTIPACPMLLQAGGDGAS